MRYEFILPDIGEGVVEGEVVRWLVGQGDDLAEDQPMVEVMTDKATVQIPSPKKGKVLELFVDEGAMAQVGQPLLALDVADGAGPGRGRADAPAPAQASPAAAAPAAKAEAAPRSAGGRVLAAPATRRLARELEVDIQSVRGTGPGGRVTKDDVQRAAAGAPAPAAASSRPAPAPTGGEERVPVRGLRRLIAEKMQRSKNTAAHFTYVDEVDMTELVALRERAQASAAERGVKLTFLPFIAKAVISALKRFPTLNATLDEEHNEVVIKHYHHLGIATATEDGLIVPVIKDAGHKSLFEIAREIGELALKAREGRLAPAEVTGSTFTITSLGKLGGLFATPIINHPEVAILGIHEIKQRPVVEDGEIAIRDIMLLSVSFDHRLIDGHVGAAFAQAVKGYLEDPHLLFLELV